MINSLTERVVAWGTRVLGKKLVESRWERTMRVLEETLELAQTEDIQRLDILRLLDYVYSRPKGTIENEAGGVMVCMVAWAHAAGLDLELLLSKEVDRIESLNSEHIQNKQRTKVGYKVGLTPDG